METGLAAGCAALVVLAIAGVVVAAVFAARAERRRKERLAAWASDSFWTYQVRPANNWAPLLPGHNKQGVTLALSGVVAGRTVSVAEYHYTTSSTDAEGRSSSTTHHYVVVAMGLPRPYPPMSVAARGALSKLGRSLFGEGKAATGNAAFDERFKISTRYPDEARRVVGPRLMAAHLANQVPAWAVSGDLLVYHFPGRITDPARVPGWAATAVAIADLLGSVD